MGSCFTITPKEQRKKRLEEICLDGLKPDRLRKLRDNFLCCFVVIIHLDFVSEAEKRQEFVCFLELNIVRLWRRAVYVRKKVFLKITGAPNDCFLKNICSKKQILTTVEYSMA